MKPLKKKGSIFVLAIILKYNNIYDNFDDEAFSKEEEEIEWGCAGFP